MHVNKFYALFCFNLIYHSYLVSCVHVNKVCGTDNIRFATASLPGEGDTRHRWLSEGSEGWWIHVSCWNCFSHFPIKTYSFIKILHLSRARKTLSRAYLHFLFLHCTINCIFFGKLSHRKRVCVRSSEEWPESEVSRPDHVIRWVRVGSD